MRKELYISVHQELEAIESLSKNLIRDGFNADNTVVVTVSTDYSSIAGQLIRHNLSINGEIAEGFGIDVPYPDEEWDNLYSLNLYDTFKIHDKEFKDKTLLLVENAIIRGGNYNFLTAWLKSHYPSVEVKTLSLYENVNSVFKSDYVWDFYDNNTQDITFHFEKFNNHWS